MRRAGQTAPPPPQPTVGGLAAAPKHERDVAIAEAARAFAETCRATTEALRKFVDAWEEDR